MLGDCLCEITLIFLCGTLTISAIFLSCNCTLKSEPSPLSSYLLFHIGNFFPLFCHLPYIYIFFFLPLLLLPAHFLPNVPYFLSGTRFKLLLYSCLYTPSLYPVVTFYITVAFPLLKLILVFPLPLLLYASLLLFSILFGCFLAQLRPLAVLVCLFVCLFFSYHNFYFPFFFFLPLRVFEEKVYLIIVLQGRAGYEVIDNRQGA